MLPELDTMTREDFIAYLEETLIPDLEESGRHYTAADFRLAIMFMKGAKMVAFTDEI